MLAPCRLKGAKRAYGERSRRSLQEPAESVGEALPSRASIDPGSFTPVRPGMLNRALPRQKNTASFESRERNSRCVLLPCGQLRL